MANAKSLEAWPVRIAKARPGTATRSGVAGAGAGAGRIASAGRSWRRTIGPILAGSRTGLHRALAAMLPLAWGNASAFIRESPLGRSTCVTVRNAGRRFPRSGGRARGDSRHGHVGIRPSGEHGSEEQTCDGNRDAANDSFLLRKTRPVYPTPVANPLSERAMISASCSCSLACGLAYYCGRPWRGMKETERQQQRLLATLPPYTAEIAATKESATFLAG